MLRVILMMILMSTAADSLSDGVVSEIRLQYSTIMAEFLRTVKVITAYT